MLAIVNSIPKMSQDQLEMIMGMVDVQMGINSRTSGSKAPTKIKVGMQVTFKPRKTKPAVTGTVVRVNTKTITVENCSDGKGWRVPPHMLSAA